MRNIWKMVRLKNKYFSESETYLNNTNQFKDAPEKLIAIKKSKTKNRIVAFISTVLAIVLIILYFFVAGNIFVNNHTHSYKDYVIKNSTCVEEGIVQQKCRYCDKKYEEPIPLTEHKYSKVNHQDSTCAQEGKNEYICEICSDEKTEAIPLKEHKYREKIEKESTCTSEGILVKQCKKCDYVVSENIPTNEEHSFILYSYKPSAFWKNGYNHYICQDCGNVEYSLRAEIFNWIMVFSIIILIIAVVIIISVLLDNYSMRFPRIKLLFWTSLICAVISTVFLICHFWVISNQNENKPVLQTISRAPIACELVEIERLEDADSENGIIVYKCQTCEKEYAEHLVS